MLSLAASTASVMEAVSRILDARVDCAAFVEWLPADGGAVGRVLAAPVVAAAPLPACPTSLMDGFAARSSDRPGRFKATARCVAGRSADCAPLATGEVAAISTGAVLPPGADCVVPVERTAAVPDHPACVELLPSSASDLAPGAWVRAPGSDVAAGAEVLAAGATLAALDLALAASVGVARVCAVVRPRVGVLSTGSELRDASGAAGATDAADATAGVAVDTNRPALLAAVRACGAEAVDLGIVLDEPGAVAAALAAATAPAAGLDVLVTTGGVSMGDGVDLVKPWLVEHAHVVFGRVAVKPGKPTTFATIARATLAPSAAPTSPVAPDTPVAPTTPVAPLLAFALPGNPASAVVMFHLLVAPALRRLAGSPAGAAFAPRVRAVLAAGLAPDAERLEAHRVVVLPASAWCDPGADVAAYAELEASAPAPAPALALPGAPSVRVAAEALVAVSTGIQRSSRLASLVGANGLLLVPAGAAPLPAGASVACVLVGPVAAPPEAWRTAARADAAARNARGEVLGGLCCGHAHPAAPAPVSAAAHGVRALAPLHVGVLTVSDRAFRGAYADASGPAVVAALQALPSLVLAHVHTAIVPDEPEAIRAVLARWCALPTAAPPLVGDDGTDQFVVRAGDGSTVTVRAPSLPVGVRALDLVLTTGGTGFSPRDVTPEAVRPLLSRPAPGLVYALYAAGVAATPMAVLSRAEAGVAGRTLVATLPGSPKGAREGVAALAPVLAHALALLRE